MSQKLYIGDGVYADYNEESAQFIVTTEDGVSVQNTIYLEHSVASSLCSYIERTKRELYLQKVAKERENEENLK